jgi:H+/Cl- antiporter ClcA
MGSPLGREGAPREIGALIADWLSRKVGVAESHRRLLVACGAGAGLAAVYNVPFGGAVFVLEVLLRTARLSAVFSATVACLVGAFVARLVLGTAPQYAVGAFPVTPALVVWAVLLGPVFGLAGLAFSRVTDAAAARAPHDKRLVLWCLLTFSAIGVLAVRYRALLGNGRGPAQLGFDDSLSWEAAATLLGLRLLAVVFALRAGAAGGRLTPSVAMGALLGLVAALGWNGFLPMVSPVAGAIIGAGVFLGAALSMPVTALVLIFEFTWPDLKLLLPLTCAFGSALALRALYRPGSERTASKDAAAR